VVGLIAVIRRILLVLTGSNASLGTSELALLIAMVVVFVAGPILVSHFEQGGE
jgi:uncharacterized membrane protein (DUF373 family)